MPVKVQNWKGTITYHADSVQTVETVEDIVRIVKDPVTYPSPVRVKGSHHSTTKCIVNENGTVIDITKMNSIVNIDKTNQTITMQAGCLHMTAAKALQQYGLQFYVNVEIGNMTVGSGACGGTKDASYYNNGQFEFGQVNAYVVGIKAVQANGELVEVTEQDGETMQAWRSSYGMLGVIYEVTYKVKPAKPMAVKHVKYHVQDFANQLDDLVAQNQSIMLYLFPFLDSVIVEYRFNGDESVQPTRWQWKLRNWVWKTGGPLFGKLATAFIPLKWLRSMILNMFNRLLQVFMSRILRGCNTMPADQIIWYPERGGFSSYTFSIFAFPREEYATVLLAYYQFCKDYFHNNGYRCDLLNVGYHIAQDRQSLFSYTRRGPALTLDPVSSGSKGWDGFLTAYNEFCIQHGGTPLFNQTRGITPLQAQAAFGTEIAQFLPFRRRYDPKDRFYTDYFRNLLEPRPHHSVSAMKKTQ